VKTLTLGSIYCTFNQKAFEWQRCEILLVNKSDASIFYTDTGSSDLVPIKTIKVLKVSYKSQKFNVFFFLFSIPFNSTKRMLTKQ
jgi:hypothetical protein